MTIETRPDKESIATRIAELSAEKRAILEKLLKEEGSNITELPITPRKRESNTYPLSYAQERLCNPAYNIPIAMQFEGKLNPAALEQSLNEIIRRHAILRTTIGTVDGQPVQFILSEMNVALQLVDLQDLPGVEQAAEVRRRIAREAHLPFDLTQGPLLRTVLLRLDEATHVFLLTVHQIAFDGWSLNVYLQELAPLYRDFSAGKPSSLSTLPIQYTDFAIWQRERLQGDVLAAQLTYWKRQLGGPLPVLELPTDRPRPPVQTYRGARQFLTLSKTLTESLKALSGQESATLFMTLLAAFKVLLYCYTGQQDVMVGSPIVGRHRAELEELIGFFVNTLVLRTDLSGNPPFRTLLRRVRKVTLEAYAHQDLPFEKLVEELDLKQELSHPPLFQVMFAPQPPTAPPEFSGLTASFLDVDRGTAMFDLALYVGDTAQGLRGALEYNTDLFDAATITRLQEQYQSLLADIAANPDQPISNLSLLPPAERDRLLAAWNDTVTDYPWDQSIHLRFEAQVKRTPGAVAVIWEDRRLTYRELNSQANQLAHYLRKRGVGPNVIVGLHLNRSLEMVVGLLGILKAGGTYVALDPAYPQEHLDFIMKDAQVSVLLTRSQLLATMPKLDAQVVCLDSDGEDIARESKQNPVDRTTVEDLAYITYAAWSTGKPAGVQVPHRALTNFLHSMHQRPGLTAQDTLLAVTPLSSDMAALELFLPINVGARVVIASREAISDGTRLSKQIANSGATVMQATPAIWWRLLRAGWQGNDRLKILCGKEILPRNLARQLKERCASLWNMYGLAETTIWSIVHEIEAIDDPISIGRPIANTQVYILDSHLQPVPIGVPGELYIGGAGLGRGYLNRPELTTQKFIPSPFGDEAGARLFKTGDLARYLPDGKIEFLGRCNDQKQIAGHRVELANVEAVLSKHPFVQETVLVARDDISADAHLVAYVVPAQKETLTVDDLRDFLKSKLPDYMVPSTFVMLEALPLTSKSKINRQTLPKPAQPPSQVKRIIAAGQDTIESQLMRIWEEVLRIRPIGLTDNYFELGGRSLQALYMFHLIKERFGQVLPLATLFRAPTIAQLADILRDEERSVSWSPLVAIQPKGSKLPFFCIHAAGGHVLYYRDLARYLGPDQPFYGLQAQGLDGKQPFYTRIEDMATLYVKEIQKVQPEGPYFLGGYCMGGTVAYEMAQQLHTQGHKVAFLALLDTYNYTNVRIDSWFDKVHHYYQKVEFHCRNLLLSERKDRIKFFEEKARELKRRSKIWSGMITSRVTGNSNGELRQHSVLAQIWEANHRASFEYVPEVYPGKITHFRPMIQYAVYDDPDLEWDNLAAGGLETYDLSVYPAGMLIEPFVKDLAEKVADCIRKALEMESTAKL